MFISRSTPPSLRSFFVESCKFLFLLRPELRAKDKRLLMDEVVTLKTEKDRLEREISRKDAQLLEAKSSVDKSTVALTNAETKIQTLKAQVGCC